MSSALAARAYASASVVSARRPEGGYPSIASCRRSISARLSGFKSRPVRAIHRNLVSAQIYAHYAPSAHEVEMVNTAFAEEPVEDSERVGR